MKTAIVYCSRHHGNTKQLLDAIAAVRDVTLIDVLQTPVPDLQEYDRIGFASGIYYSKFHKAVLQAAETQLPQGKDVFFLYTFGAKKEGYTNAIRQAVSRHDARILGEYGCFGWNTFGPFRLVGGMAKGHPDQMEQTGALAFFDDL